MAWGHIPDESDFEREMEWKTKTKKEKILDVIYTISFFILLSILIYIYYSIKINIVFYLLIIFNILNFIVYIVNKIRNK